MASASALDRIETPPLFAVLVNPRVPLSTARFRPLPLAPNRAQRWTPHPHLGEGAADFIERLAEARNDLEPTGAPSGAW